MLKIYGKASSINVRKVLWTCAELDIPFERFDFGSGFSSTLTPAFLKMNPNGMVPVIDDNGFVLWESNSICRYLAGRASRIDFLPIEPRARALVEKWMDWQATELNNSWRYAFMALVREHESFQDAAQIEAGVASWNHHMTMLDAQLQQTGGFMTGDKFTCADIVIGLSTHRWLSSPMQRPDLPAVAAYYERLSERSGFMAHVRNGQP